MASGLIKWTEPRMWSGWLVLAANVIDDLWWIRIPAYTIKAVDAVGEIFQYVHV